jgi:hypothetical protein
VGDPLAELESLLTAASQTPDPSERAAKLRELRERINGTLGFADRLLANSQRAREAGAAGLERRRMAAREEASLREAAERGGDRGLEEVPTHRDLDELAEEGLLDTALEQSP